MNADRVSRGSRVKELQELHGERDDNVAFAERLNQAAKDLGLPEEWNSGRLSKVKGGGQDLSTNDGFVLASIDPKKRGFTWVMYDVPMKAGEDALQVLAREAKRRKAG